jgi:hypothetical protein
MRANEQLQTQKSERALRSSEPGGSIRADRISGDRARETSTSSGSFVLAGPKGVEDSLTVTG